MRLEPLPFRTRLGHGETITSWAPRHAVNNATTVKDIDRILRSQKVFTSRSPYDADRARAWRALGALHEEAFTEPEVVAGNWVVTRSLCSRCLPPHEEGKGRLPNQGWVCLKHKRWFGEPQCELADFGKALVAERHWRRTLARRGVLVESPVARLAEEAATVGVAKSLRQERSERAPAHSPGLLVYPETVALVRVLTRRSFLDLACDPDAPGTVRRALVEREVHRILPDVEDAEAWRAVARVWTMVTDLSALIRDSRLVGMIPEDAKYNVLRYSGWLAQPPQGLGRRAEVNRDGGAR